MEFKDELKSTIIESGWTITKVVEEMNRLNGTYTSVQNFSSKMIRETFKYTEVEQILSIIGYKIEWKPKHTSDLHGWNNPLTWTNQLHETPAEYTVTHNATLPSIDKMLASEYFIKNSLEKYIDKSMEEIYKKIVKLNEKINKRIEDE